MNGAAPNPAPPRVGVAISTIGRWDAVRSLLEDLAAQTQPPAAVTIAHHDQTDPEALTALVQSFAHAFPIRTVVSARGLSNGRNTAAATFDEDIEWIWFPNDTSGVDSDFLEIVARHCTAPTTVCAVQMVDSEGPRNPLPAPGTKLTRRNVWGAIEPATFFKRDEFHAVGGFNPLLGTGADSPWQSGEGTDLLLRMSTAEGFSIAWLDGASVRAHTEFAHLPPDERRRKLRSYGRGAGNLLRRWNYPLWYKAAHLVAAALMPLRNPAKFGPRDGWALLIGRTEGVVGRPFTRELDTRAVLR